MAKIISIQYLVLRPGVKAEEFEQFVARTTPTIIPWPGMRSYVAKGDRGDRDGKYALFFEFDDVETRNHYFPQPDVLGVDAQQYLANWLPFIAEWERYTTWAGSPTVFTDYVVFGEF